jgi:hypothetical protein
MNTLEYIKNKAEFIGHFDVHGSTMTFHRREGLRRKELIEMGDMVYFMFVGGKLMKIGKAGGAQGFANRAGTYNRGRAGDATNNRIIDIMEEIKAKRIDVYAVRAPRQSVKYECPLTGEMIVEEVPTHKNVETRLTAMYLDENTDNELPFCNQLT